MCVFLKYLYGDLQRKMLCNQFPGRFFIHSRCFSLRLPNDPTSCIQLPLKVGKEKAE